MAVEEVKSRLHPAGCTVRVVASTPSQRMLTGQDRIKQCVRMAIHR
jgi:hypothetical protein